MKYQLNTDSGTIEHIHIIYNDEEKEEVFGTALKKQFMKKYDPNKDNLWERKVANHRITIDTSTRRKEHYGGGNARNH